MPFATDTLITALRKAYPTSHVRLLPEPAIPFTAPTAVAAGGGKVYVADRKSRRIAVITMKFAAEENCDIK